jgi:UDP-2,4-diacetamido-2,4,6-trideoxy-beta-L-altropyranose hydrolase
MAAAPLGDTVCFRVDASLQMGTGHVMRCLALADALAHAGARCHFICRAEPGDLIAEILRRGHVVHELPAGDSRADAAATATTLAKLAAPVLVVDHYELDRTWEQMQRPHCARLLVIDDLANRPHDCDFLVDQNLGRHASDYGGLVPSHCVLLAGPAYALLRPEFAELRPESLRRREHGRLARLLIAMGGVDAANATGQVLTALAGADLPPGCEVAIVMGAHAPWLEQVREQAGRLPCRARVHVDVADMARHMAESDAAIGAAGVTAWERCCLGLPAILVVLAANQWPGARALERSGAALLLGEAPAIAAGLPRAMRTLTDSTRLRQMAKIAGRIADGLGVQRVIRQLRTAP